MYLHRIDVRIAAAPVERDSTAIAHRARRAARAAERVLHAREARAERRRRRSAPRQDAFLVRARLTCSIAVSLPG
jgi:predicted ATPase with chaperone activity